MVFKDVFPKARVQRCQVYAARNVLAKVAKTAKKKVADDLRSIFYAFSIDKTMKFFNAFKDRWEKELRSAVKSLESFIESSLIFFYYPKEEWVSLRTKNIVEQLNKEFKKRTRWMEILIR